MYEAPSSLWTGEDIVRPCGKPQEAARNALLGVFVLALVTKIWTFNGWRRIGAPSSTLAEQSSNAATVLSSRKINVTINSYGRSVKISDLFEKTGIAPAAQGAIERLMQSAKEFFGYFVPMSVALAQ